MISYKSLSASSKWFVSWIDSYLIPKSSTTREKMVGLVACFHSAGIRGTSVCLYFLRCAFNRSLAILPACFKPGIPFSMWIYTQPLEALDYDSYYCILSSGMSRRAVCMYLNNSN